VKEFLDMGGYAFYVWSSFGITAVVLLLNVFITRAALRRARLDVRRRVKALEAQDAPEA